MIRFLIKGLLRDRSRSLFPVLTVATGVFLAVFLYAFMQGVMGDMFDSSARFSSGHVKIMTRAYAEESAQTPNDLALMNVASLSKKLKQKYPDKYWIPRIRFGGLLDVPDEKGETRAQGPVSGMAVDLSKDSPEIEILNIQKALIQGRLPSKPGEILISDLFAEKLGVIMDETVTLMSSTAEGSMAMYNFKVVGTVSFGIIAMDRGSIIVDIKDAQYVLDMPDSTGELLGIAKDMVYSNPETVALAQEFNSNYSQEADEFSPVMKTLAEDSGLGDYIGLVSSMGTIIVSIFIFAMSIVLWNAGLLGNLRRYGEIGVRLAVGESNGHVYRAMILESVAVGLAGSIVGTAVGLLIAYPMQIYGLDFSSMLSNTSMMMNSVYRAKVTLACYYIGFIPGVFATVLGATLSGIGIYKRSTAQLFKELEV